MRRDLAEASTRLISGMAREARGQPARPMSSQTSKPVYGDARAIKQVIINLLSNAVKFAPPAAR